ncbi:hypothetical protein TNCV_2446021 [Trichonephila clavipes]|nr:hypothetical protein TNCV_2446021 [Trichonephila clavipes]
MGEIRWEFAPGRVTLDVLTIPLCPAKISRLWSQDRLLPFQAPILGSTEGAHFLLHMNSLTLDTPGTPSSVSLMLACEISYLSSSHTSERKRVDWHNVPRVKPRLKGPS